MLITIASALVPVVVMAAVWASSGSSSGGFIPIDHVYAIDEDTLLVAGISGDDSDIHRTSRLALLELDGSLDHPIQLRGELEVLGVADDIVWLYHPEHSIHARTLPGLEMISGIGEAVRANPKLSEEPQAVAFNESAVVVRGRDAKKHRIGRDASIALAQQDEPMTRAGYRHSGEPAISPEEFRELSTRASALGELTNASVQVPKGTPVPALDDPPSVVLVSFEPVAGGKTSQRLSRMSKEGELLWSTPTQELMDVMQLDHQTVLIEWVGGLDGQLWVLLELVDAGGEGDAHYVQALARIDPESGEVLESRLVGLPS